MARFRRTGTAVHQSHDKSHDATAARGSGVRAINQTAKDMSLAS
jgi:hypothetical protein